jgi:hypothetical protein
MIWDGWFLLCLFLHSSSYNLKYCWEIIYHSEKTFPVSQLALYDWEMKVDRHYSHQLATTYCKEGTKEKKTNTTLERQVSMLHHENLSSRVS